MPMNDDPAPPWKWNKANVQSVGGGFLVGEAFLPGLLSFSLFLELSSAILS